jgi:hypothetical protein
MSRVIPCAVAALTLLGAIVPPAAAQMAIEMDVLDLDELPDTAIQRMREAQQRQAMAVRNAQRQAPSVPGFLPDDSLGSRGLAGLPPPDMPDAFDDRGDRHGPRDDHGDRHGHGGG